MPTRSIVLPVTGLTCSNCCEAIELIVKQLPGIREVHVDYAAENAHIVYENAHCTVPDIVRHIRRNGFGVASGTVSLQLIGLSDPSAGVRLEADLAEINGIISASVNPASESIVVHYIPLQISLRELITRVNSAGFSLANPELPEIDKDESAEARKNAADHEWKFVLTGLSLTLPLILFSMLRDFRLIGFAGDRYAMLVVAAIVQFVVGAKFYAGALRGIKQMRPSMDLLIIMGSSAAFITSLCTTLGLFAMNGVYFETSAAIITLIRLGKYLETRAKGKVSAAISAMQNLRPALANVIQGNSEISVPTASLQPGDIIIVRPGERVPADGIVLEGQTSCNESLLTGESVPVNKTAGSTVIGGTLNHEGFIHAEVTASSTSGILSGIIRMVRDAQAGKAPIQKLADEIGRYFVPIVIGIALLTFAGWLQIDRANWSGAMINAIAVLIIACPCAIGLATPAAVLAGTIKAAGEGILYRNAESLEKAGKAHVILLDKTGTITQGNLQVTEIIPLAPFTADSLLQLAACAESGSGHPIAKTLVETARQKHLTFALPENFRAYNGFGVKALCGSVTVVIGNERMILNEGLSIDCCRESIINLQVEGKTVLIIAAENEDGILQVAGIIGMTDTIKPGAREAVANLKELGLDVMMITGDNIHAANAVARQVGITRVLAGCTPEEKAAEITKLQNSRSLGNNEHPVVIMAGDGINDAPALARADVGIALGCNTDIATEVSGISLPGSNPGGIVRAVELSRKVSHTIIQNLIWAFAYNILLIPVAGFGLLSPMFSSFAMTFSSLFVISNSMRLRSIGKRSVKSASLKLQAVRAIPRLLPPAGSLALLIIVPMFIMPADMNIRGALPTSMPPALMMIMAMANGLIAVSYSSIPFFLYVFVRKRTDLPFSWVIVMFGLFILACGTTHFVHVVGIWKTVDWWQAMVDSLCAVVSIATAILVWPILPRLLAIPSPAQLRRVNSELQTERDKLILTQNELQKAYEEIERRVEERTNELVITNQRLQKEILERSKAEEAMRQSEEYFRNIFEHSSVGKTITSLSGTFRANEAFQRMLGYTSAELDNVNWKTLTHPEDISADEEIIESLVNGKNSYTRWVKRYIHKDGQIIWADISTTLQRNASNEPLYFITTILDITQQKQTELELRQSETRFRQLLQAMPVPILVSDKDSSIVFRNKQFITTIGYGTGEVDSADQWFLSAYPDKALRKEVRQRWNGYMENAIQTGLPIPADEYHVTCKDGRTRDMIISGTFLDEDLIVAFIDITDRKHAEREIIKLNESLEARVLQRTEQLEESNKELEAFSYSVSHDLRAPLRHISGYVELLVSKYTDILPEKGKHYLLTIADSANQMGTLIDDLLRFSRTGRQEMNIERLDMNALCSEARNSVLQDSPAHPITWEIPNLPPIAGDQPLIRQVWINLFANAVKFTSTREQAIISVSVEELESEFLFTITDNGVGFDMKYVHKLFGVFQRLHSSEEFTGTGIGLANVRRIIARHSGRIWAESSLNNGAKFSFTLPKYMETTS